MEIVRPEVDPSFRQCKRVLWWVLDAIDVPSCTGPELCCYESRTDTAQACQLVASDVRSAQLKWVKLVMQIDVVLNEDGSRARELVVRGDTTALDVRWKVARALHA